MRHFLVALALAVGAASPGTSAQQNPVIDTFHLPRPQPDTDFAANDINSRGVVTGTIVVRATREEDVDRGRAFVWTRAGGYRVFLDNAGGSDINNSGQVIGLRRNCPGECEFDGFLWSESTGTIDLPGLWPYAINNAGVIVGEIEDRFPRVGFMRSASGVIRELPVGFVPTDVNDRGAVSGTYARDGITRAAVWGGSYGLRDLDASTSAIGIANAINKSGTVAGERLERMAVPRRNWAMLWTPFGGVRATQQPSTATAISDRGWVVGAANHMPALWLVGRRLIPLPVPAGTTFGLATAVNDAGQILGFYADATGRHYVIWTVR